jgi:hypothetical protein
MATNDSFQKHGWVCSPSGLAGPTLSRAGLFSHDVGHLGHTVFGWKGDPQLNPLHRDRRCNGGSAFNRGDWCGGPATGGPVGEVVQCSSAPPAAPIRLWSAATSALG